MSNPIVGFPPWEEREMATQDPLDGKIALVTGASGGIGQAIATELAARGAALALAYGANAGPAEELAAAIAKDGGRSIALGADLRAATAPDELVDAVEDALGPIDVLVANAGAGRIASWDDVDADLFDETLAINLRAPYLLARRVVGGMAERGYGRVVFMSSVAAFIGGVIGPHYAASKAGLHGLTHYFAGRLAASGVTVNAIAPALIEDTGMELGDHARLAARIPVGRLGTPAEVADLTVAVLTNAYLTNQVVSVDGGMYPR
jgi:3-oxoacyl-[acyl-carrier protein] reductase